MPWRRSSTHLHPHLHLRQRLLCHRSRHPHHPSLQTGQLAVVQGPHEPTQRPRRNQRHQRQQRQQLSRLEAASVPSVVAMTQHQRMVQHMERQHQQRRPAAPRGREHKVQPNAQDVDVRKHSVTMLMVSTLLT